MTYLILKNVSHVIKRQVVCVKSSKYSYCAGIT